MVWFYSVSATGADGCVYRMTFLILLVAWVNVSIDTLTPIDQDLSDGRCRWMRGVLAKNGCIHCVPADGSTEILKIDTINGITKSLMTEYQSRI
jgi:hypothetical protein